jgi:hypothetical protein
MTPSSQLHAIAALHSTALQHYQQGAFDVAKEAFGQVLNQLKSVCADFDDEHEDSQSPNTFHAAPLHEQYYKSLPCDMYCIEPKEDLHSNEEIFRGAIRLANDIPVDVQSVAAATIYNLALIHHIDGLAQNKSSLLVKALEFYKRSLYVIEQQCDRESVALTIVTAALYHNMTQIHSFLFHVEEARDMIYNLSELTSWMVHEYKPYKIIPDVTIDFFILSSCFVDMDTFKLAPAA